VLCNLALKFIIHHFPNSVIFLFVAECTPGEAFSVLGEKGIFASGSPFDDVNLGIYFNHQESIFMCFLIIILNFSHKIFFR
jgi:hypothetical protein